MFTSSQLWLLRSPYFYPLPEHAHSRQAHLCIQRLLRYLCVSRESPGVELLTARVYDIARASATVHNLREVGTRAAAIDHACRLES